MSEYFDDHYDVVIIGAALSGLAAAITLLPKGFKTLVLEQHNLPGGVATSFSRGGIEIEASLHEMMSIGSEEKPLKIRKFLEENGVKVDWIRVPLAYRFVSPDTDVRIHAGKDGDFSIPAKEIAAACGDKNGKLEAKLLKFFRVCHNVYDSVNELSINPMGKLQMAIYHNDFVRTAGYSAKEVLDTFKFPKKAVDILSAYWIYVGSPLSDLPFTIFAFLLADYLGYGSYIPRMTSHELSLRMAERAEALGAQIEYGQKVEKILVENGKVKGVRLINGEEISCDYVISGAYPNAVYSRMIEPPIEVPNSAKKFVNGMDLGVTCFSLVLVLDESAEALGITDYSTFYAPNGMDTDRIFESGKRNGEWEYITSICANLAHKEASPEGTCVYSITYLPSPSAFEGVNADNYEEYKQRHVSHFLDLESNRLGIDLRAHIKEMVVETPVTIAHYTGAHKGAIYGYRHAMKNHVVARLQMASGEHYISGLSFAGSHQISGDGMGPAITNGRKGAKEIIEERARREGK